MEVSLMIKENYHTHTYRCGHAIGTDEEYILEAISCGITELGFSDHIFLPHHSQIGIGGEYEELEGYISSLEALREKYKDRIKIRIGFEAEAMASYFPYYRKLLEEGRVEYLILGNHCDVSPKGGFVFYFSHATSKKDIIKYTNTLVKGIKTGLFKVVAHPDYYMGSYLKWDSTTKSCAKKICKAAKKYNVKLEFNFGAVRRGKRLLKDEYRFAYPYHKFWEIAKKYNNIVVVGVDAHNPNALTSEKIKLAYKLADDVGITITEKLDIVNKKGVIICQQVKK